MCLFWSEPQKLERKLLGAFMYIHHGLEEKKEIIRLHELGTSQELV